MPDRRFQGCNLPRSGLGAPRCGDNLTCTPQFKGEAPDRDCELKYLPMEIDDRYLCFPRRQAGWLVLLLTTGVLLIGIVFGLWQASQAETASTFLFYAGLVAVAAILLPPLGYRLYGLQNASYEITRNGIRLRWGWRLEDIPAYQVEWVGYAQNFEHPLPSPLLALPGAVVGERRLPDGRILEYLADRLRNLVLIVTPQRIYAISPAQPGDFLLNYQRLMEYGSLTPLQAQSVKPNFWLTPFQANRPARWLLIGNIFLALTLFAIVAVATLSREQISLRFTPAGEPLDEVPIVRLYLLPVLNLLFVVCDDALGAFFYRRQEWRSLSYLLWGSALATTILFLGAIVFILRTG